MQPFEDGMLRNCVTKNNAFLMIPMLGENWHNNHVRTECLSLPALRAASDLFALRPVFQTLLTICAAPPQRATPSPAWLPQRSHAAAAPWLPLR